MLPKFKKVGDWNDFCEGRMIIVQEPHEWAGEKTNFVEMAYANGSRADPEQKLRPTLGLLMKVKTRFGTELLLKGTEAFIVEKQIPFRPNEN